MKQAFTEKIVRLLNSQSDFERIKIESDLTLIVKALKFSFTKEFEEQTKADLQNHIHQFVLSPNEGNKNTLLVYLEIITDLMTN
ncbi:hypothetical protein [Flavobacterium sp.]|uniref:hypothetical protein n=1 Tax=Flavobacterium sp. TaxID=239 RepID=UPI003A8DB6B9